MPGETLTLDLVANDKASNEINNVSREVRELDEMLARLSKHTRERVTVSNALIGALAEESKASSKLNRLLASEKRSAAELTRAELELARARQAATKAAREQAVGGRGGVAALNSLVGGLGSAVSQYGALGPAALAAAAATGAFGAALDVTSSALRLQASLLVGAVSQALAFEQEITRVAAVTGEGAGAFDRLRQAALDGGAATLFTAQQAAEALRFLAQAGLSADEASRALPGSLQLAAAGSLDLAKAADIATNVMSGFKLGVEGINRVNDVLVLGANRSNTNVQELGIAFSYAAGIANSTGNDLESVAAVFAVLANNGIKASRAGTAVATGISRLQKPTPEAAAALNALGVSLTSAEGKTKPLVEVLRELERAGATSRDIITIFGQVAGGKLITVLNTGTKALDDFQQQFRRSAGAAEEFQRVLQDTADAQLKIFQSTVETLSITIGSQFLPNVKGVSQALTEQGSILLKNTALLGEFENISDASVKTLANLLRISAEIVPPFIQLGGAVLVAGENLQFLVEGAAKGVLAFSGLSKEVELLGKITSGAGQVLGLFSDTQDASNKLAEETRARLLAAADSVGEVNKEAVTGQRVLLLASTAARRFAIEAGLIEPPKQANTLADVIGRLKGNYDQATEAARRFAQATSGGAGAAADVSPELVAQREIARLDAQIATSKDARKRAELTYEKELAELRGQELDDEIRASKEAALLGKLEADLLAAKEAGRKAASKGRKEDISAKLAELDISARLLTTSDQRLQIDLRYEQALVRINATKDAQAIKDAQINVAQLERDTARLELSRQLYREQVAGETEALRLRAQLISEGGKIVAIDLERRAALKALAAEQDISDEVRALREAVILADAEKATREAILVNERRLFAQFQSRNALELSALAARGDRESQIAALRIQSSERLRQIAIEESDEIVRGNLQLKERRELEEKIAKLRAEQLLETTGAVRGGATAGFATDTSAISALFASESAADLENKVRGLELAKQAAEQRGLDTTFLERRIEGLRAEAEAERAVAEATVARIEAASQLAGGLTDLGTRLAEFAELGFKAAGGYDAMGTAIATAAGLGTALAQGLGLSARAAAKVQVAFNAAAAIAAFAGYAASGFAAPNLLTASIQYGAAAAKFGVIAGVSGGGGGRSGGGGGGGAGVGGAVQRYDAAAERDKTALAFARALREQMERPVQQIINIDMKGATVLENNPQVAAKIYDSVVGRNGSTYGSGRRARL